jgi:hypothetical protein
MRRYGWKKSSFSSSDTDCVEVANTLDAIRDSKNPQVTLDGVNVRALVNAFRSATHRR